MKEFQRYISFVFLKNFFVIFLGLNFFYLSIDLISNLNDADGIPLKILYIAFSFLDGINYTLFVALIFAMIVTKISMIKSGELVALYSFGISKKDVIKPIFILSTACIALYIGAKFTPFSYVEEYKKNIINNNSISNSSEHLFIKYFDTYAYIEKLNPIQQEAFGITIYQLEGMELLQIIKAKRASFINDGWHIKEAQVITKPNTLEPQNAKLNVTSAKDITVLQGFKPKIMDNIFDRNGGYSFFDAYDALLLFYEQGFSTQKIRSLIYQGIFFPLFVPFLSIILFYYLPVTARYASIALISSAMIFLTLCIWAILFLLAKLSLSGTLIPELGTIAPIFILASIAFYLNAKNS